MKLPTLNALRSKQAPGLPRKQRVRMSLDAAKAATMNRRTRRAYKKATAKKPVDA